LFSARAALGATPIGGAPQVFQKMIEDDYYNWGKVIRAAARPRTQNPAELNRLFPL
jgi:hypothetical protein